MVDSTGLNVSIPVPRIAIPSVGTMSIGSGTYAVSSVTYGVEIVVGRTETWMQWAYQNNNIKTTTAKYKVYYR